MSFVSQPILGVVQDEPYNYDITTSDPDNGDALLIEATTLPAWLAFIDNGNGTANLSGTPLNDDSGDHDVVLKVFFSLPLTSHPSRLNIILQFVVILPLPFIITIFHVQYQIQALNASKLRPHDPLDRMCLVTDIGFTVLQVKHCPPLSDYLGTSL